MARQLIEVMISAVEDSVVSFTEFMLAHKDLPDGFFCFFEGGDDSLYYKPKIFTVIAKSNFFEFNCGGKEKVKHVYSLIKNHNIYSSCKTGFFIDRDFDSPNSNPEIYETPCYSVENLYVYETSIREILIDYFKLPRGGADLDICVNLYSKLLTEFHENTLNLNTWLSCFSDYRNAHNPKRRVNIDGTLGGVLDNVVKNDLSNIVSLTQVSDLINVEILFTCTGLIDVNSFNIRLAHFKKVNQIETFRGKFQLKFLSSFLRRLKDVIGSNGNILVSKKYKCSYNFDYHLLMGLLDSHANVPHCLIAYLNKLVL